MNHNKLVARASFAFCFIVFLSLMTTAQSSGGRDLSQIEQSYDVALHLVIGSNDGASRAGGELPASLTNVLKQLKANFAFSNYRLTNTFLGRVSNNGTFEYRSLGTVSATETAPPQQSFLEWTFANCRSMLTAKGRPGLQAEAFRFGARVPVPVGGTRAENATAFAVVSYESIGLTISKVGLAEETPTLIGTLNLPGASGTIFLIMTVRATD